MTKMPPIKRFDLIDRTTEFAVRILEFTKTLPENSLIFPLRNQLILSGTSIGANYHEADCAESRKDFQHKIGICKKEAKETMYWLKIIPTVLPEKEELCRVLRIEAHELTLIFSAIYNKSKI